MTHSMKIKTSPDEQVYMNCIMYTSVCVPQSVTLNVEYTHVPALQSWARFQKSTRNIHSLNILLLN